MNAQIFFVSVSSRAFCYQAKTIEAVSWALFIIRPSCLSLSSRSGLIGDQVLFFLIFLVALANRAQVLGWPDIWQDDIFDLPWFGEYPGYPGGIPFYSQYTTPQAQALEAAPLASGPATTQVLGNGGVYQQQLGHSIIIWPGVNGEAPRIEQRPGIVTHDTLSS
jgi:hypothetical protein